VKITRVQYQVPLPDAQTITGLLSATRTATECSVPAAQLGLQSSIFSVPVPSAWPESHAVQVMFHSAVVPSPDSPQPVPQAGR